MTVNVYTGSRTEQTQPERCRALWEDGKEYFSAYHRRITENLDFSLKLRHWEDDPGQTRDRRRIQPKGIELYNLIRHKAGQIAKQGMFLESRPVDDQTDEARAELAKWCVEHVLFDPGRRYPVHRERLVVGALASGIWGLEWFYDPSDGPFGDISFEAFDPRRFVWAPGHLDSMESRCPWTIKHVPMTLDQLLVMKESGNWKNVDKVRAEDVVGAERTPGWPLDQISFHDQSRAGPRNTTTPIVHVLFCRFKRDLNRKKKVVRDPFKPLAPEQRYMSCANCGFQTTTHPRRPDGSLPPQGEACPQCNAAFLERVDHQRIEDDILAYPEGRLSIIAPYQDVTFYDDVWPQKLRGFPQLTFGAYTHPAEPIGMSDTDLNWDLQLVSNSMLRMGYEQMSESRGVLVAPEDGLTDVNGEPFTFSDANGRVAFRSPEALHDKIEFFQPQGLNTAWATYFNAIQGVFKSNLGTSDLGLTPTASKDIAVGTVRALMESGEIPVDHHVMMLRLAETYMVNNLLDMIRATWSEPRFVRTFGPNGRQAMALLRGSDIPSADLRLHAEPSLRQLKGDEARTFAEMANLPPHIRRFVAKQLNVSPLALRELERDEHALQAAAAAPPQSVAGPPSMDEAPMPDAIAQRINGKAA